ncbi:sulfatase-like hydrolase/transferase [Candidatus Micrarchaeota archaeon]|nr:sulfatase-like hydrolase/transferase [Candidatus Micrarchaeota archaeon]
MDKKNLILITIDCLRADYSHVLIETLAKRLGKPVAFTNCMALGPATALSFPGMFTSAYGQTINLLHVPKNPENSLLDLASYGIKDDKLPIPEVLKENNYRTLGINSNVWVSQQYGFGRGFDHLFDALTSQRKTKHLFTTLKVGQRISFLGPVKNFLKKIYWKFVNNPINNSFAKATSVNKLLLQNINENEKGLFVWVHYMDCHWPFLPPGKYLRSIGMDIKSAKKVNKILHKCKEGRTIENRELELYKKLYIASIEYVSDSLLQLFEALENKGIMDDTVVILTADHGEGFLEHDFLAHISGSFTDENDCFKAGHREILNVPLAIYGLKQFEPRIIDKTVSHISLAPTIVDILGIKKPKKWEGKSILNLIDDGGGSQETFAISEFKANDKDYYVYTSRKWKFFWRIIDDQCRLFNLITDPKETTDISSQNPEIVKELKSTLRDHAQLHRVSKKDELRNRIRFIRSKLKK